MTQLRNDLIVITSRIADEPAAAFEQLETYIKNEIIKAKIETYDSIMRRVKEMDLSVASDTVSSEARAYDLYCIGNHSSDIAETLGDEFPELDGDQIAKIILDAWERYKENKVRHDL